MMKKLWIVCIAAVILLLAVCIIFGSTVYQKQMEEASIGIIGGADGPTAVLVTGNIVKSVLPVFLCGIALIVVSVCVIFKRQKKSR